MIECFFCENIGGEVLYDSPLYRIILVEDCDYPGYLRVVANQHCKELTDLSQEDNLEIYQAVIKAEKILRTLFQPDKINVASFGNLTPHVHWHIIPRFFDDKHFPNPIWGAVTHPEFKVPVERSQLNVQLKKLSTDFFSLGI